MAVRSIDDARNQHDFAGFAVLCPLFVLLFTLVSGPAFAGKWFATPQLTVRETFSDNINLNPNGSRQSAFVTEINPGVTLQRIGGRTRVNLNYQMQNVLNGGGGGGTQVNHQLLANASTVIEPNRLSVNATSTVSQQNIVNTGRITTGNLNNFSNRADVYTFSVNPTWTPRFDGYFNGVVRLGYDFVGTSSSQAANANTFRGNVALTSGYRFNRITWSLGYDDSYSQRSAGGDVRFRDYLGQINYNFNRKYAVFVQGGYFDNSLPNVTTTNNQNGEFYTFGAAWTPNRRFDLQASYGKNLYTINWRWLPTQRTRINLGFRHSKVGTNIGSVWNANLFHQSARVSWQGSYVEDTTTVQNILLGQSILNTGNTNLNALNQTVFSPVVTQGFASNVGLPTFTNDILIQKRGQISVSGGTGKSLLSLTLFNSRRQDQTTLVEDNSTGVSAFWNWRYRPRMNARLLLSWNRNTTNFQSVLTPNTQADFYILNLGLTRNIGDYFNISRGIFGSLDYRFTKQDSSNSQFSYTENSVAATLAIIF